MTPSAFTNLVPGDVVSHGSTRAVVITSPQKTRTGQQVELRIGTTRLQLTAKAATNWSLDA